MATEILPRVVPFSQPSKPFEPITRAAICARVSTGNHGQDPTMQTRELEELLPTSRLAGLGSLR
jgi:hypothetical protein